MVKSRSIGICEARIGKFSIALSLLILLILSSISGARASDSWEFVVAPYLLAPSITGNAGVGRFVNGADVDIDTGDIIDNIDLGGMIHGEAHHESGFGILADFSFMDLSSKVPGPLLPGTTIKGEVFQSVTELHGSYRFDFISHQIDVYGGLRWWHMDVKLTRQGAAGPLSLIESTEDWVDPVLGARWVAQLGPNWRSSLASDIGGFGVGSDISFSLQALALYDFSESTTLAFGYRALYVDYENGHPGTAGYFAYDTTTHGPMVGVAFRF
jgi:hypothetical protein